MLTLANQTFSSRLLMGTGKFSSPSIMKRSVKSAKSTIVTLAMKRLSAHIEHDNSLALFAKARVEWYNSPIAIFIISIIIIITHCAHCLG